MPHFDAGGSVDGDNAVSILRYLCWRQNSGWFRTTIQKDNPVSSCNLRTRSMQFLPPNATCQPSGADQPHLEITNDDIINTAGVFSWAGNCIHTSQGVQMCHEMAWMLSTNELTDNHTPTWPHSLLPITRGSLAPASTYKTWLIWKARSVRAHMKSVQMM